MSYTVLARKWRPKRFSELVGQQHAKTTLVNALDQGRLHHAYLFTGTRGVGKTSIARIFAKSLNCESGTSADPCGVCSVCSAIDAGNYVDLIEIDAASRTRVEDTREILDNVPYAPTQGRYKVYLIDEVHMLSKHSFNALLKTLEEPPSHVKFLLATTDPQKLPITILSRCLQFNLKALSRSEISQQLSFVLEQEGIAFEDEAINLLAKAANGSMRDSLSLTDQAVASCQGTLSLSIVQEMLGTLDKQFSRRLLSAVLSGEAEKAFSVVHEIAEFAPDYKLFTDDLLAVLHLAAMSQLIDNAAKLSGDEARFVKQIAAQLSAQDIQLLYQIVLNGKRDLLLAPEPMIGFEMLVMRLLAFSPLGPVTPIKQSLPDDVHTSDGSQAVSHNLSFTASSTSTAPSTSDSQALAPSSPLSSSLVAGEQSAKSTSQAQVNLADDVSTNNSDSSQRIANDNQEIGTVVTEDTVNQVSNIQAPEPSTLDQTETHAVEVQSSPSEVTVPQEAVSNESLDVDSDVNDAETAALAVQQQDILAQAATLKEASAVQEPLQSSQPDVAPSSSEPEVLSPIDAILQRRKQVTTATSDTKTSDSKIVTSQAKLQEQPATSVSSVSAPVASPLKESQLEQQVENKTQFEANVADAQYQPELSETHEQNTDSTKSITSEADVPFEPTSEAFVKQENTPAKKPESQVKTLHNPANFKQDQKAVSKIVDFQERLQQRGITPVAPQDESAEAPKPTAQAQQSVGDEGPRYAYLECEYESLDEETNDDSLTDEEKQQIDAVLGARSAADIDEWSGYIKQMQLTGLARQLVLNATFQLVEGQVQLAVDKRHQHLDKPAVREYIEAALMSMIGGASSVHVEFVDDPGQTPMQIQGQLNQARLTNARELAKNDSNIQAFESRFGGFLDEETVIPR